MNRPNPIRDLSWRRLSVAVASAWCFTLAACGGTQPATGVVGNLSFAQGAGNNVCGSAGFSRDFSGTCVADLVQFAGGGIGLGTGGRVPLLSVDNPPQNQPYAWNTGVQVRNGDQVDYVGSGKWGTASVSTGSLLWGIIQYGSYNTRCGAVSIDGIATTGQNAAENMDGALVASDGANFYRLGTRASFTISRLPDQQLGRLFVGINIPSRFVDANTLGICANVRFQRFRVVRRGV